MHKYKHVCVLWLLPCRFNLTDRLLMNMEAYIFIRLAGESQTIIIKPLAGGCDMHGFHAS